MTLRKMIEEIIDKFDDYLTAESPDDTEYEIWRDECITDILSAIRDALPKEEEREIKPYMIHNKGNGTDCCYCSVCGESELNMQDNKNKKGEYLCKCSRWTSSYEGEWIGFIDSGEKAKEYAEAFYPSGWNAYRNEVVKRIGDSPHRKDI